MKIDKDGRITIETEHEARLLYDLCGEIDEKGNFRDADGQVYSAIHRWLKETEAKPELLLVEVSMNFTRRAYQACAAWWKVKVERSEPKGRPYDDSM